MESPLRRFVTAITPPFLLRGLADVVNYARFRSAGHRVYRLKSGRLYYSGMNIGENWDEIGQLQFDFLVGQGLSPQHHLLDVGCGSLRGGVHFVRYLADGHYCGVDREQWLLDAAVEIELPRYGLADRLVHLICRDDFDFSPFGLSFDYMLAQSVFTHLPWNSILLCLVNVRKSLKPEGRFYATYFEAASPEHRLSPITYPDVNLTTYPDRDPYHYELDVFKELARRVGLKLEYIGDWNHPRHQRMLVFHQQ